MTYLSMEQSAELDLLRAIIKSVPDAFYIASASGNILDIYEGNERTFHMNYQQLIGKHYTEAFSPRFCAIADKTIHDAITSQATQYITYALKPEEIYFIDNPNLPETTFWFEGRIDPIRLPHFDEPLILWNARDITQRIKLEEEIKQLIDYDELTGIFSRRHFLTHLSDLYNQFKRYHFNISVIMLDIDNFKNFNDDLGHLTGDIIIQHVTQICSKELREGDILGRLGGEEFAIILPHTGLEQAFNMAERLRLAIASSTCEIPEQEAIRVTVSFGISQFLLTDSGVTNVLGRADKAMYSAKRQGRNKVVIFNP